MNKSSQYIKREKSIVKDNNLDDVFSLVQTWLKKEKAIVTEIAQPSFVKVIHQYGVDNKVYKKELEVTLNQLENDVEVELSVNRTLNYSVNSSSIVFFGLYEDFFSHIGAIVSKEMLRRLYSQTTLDRMIRNNLFVILFFSSISLLFLTFLDLNPFLSILSASAMFIPSLFSILSVRKFQKLKQTLSY